MDQEAIPERDFAYHPPGTGEDTVTLVPWTAYEWAMWQAMVRQRPALAALLK